MKVLVISGSRDPEGQTARASEALLDGVRSQGGEGEIVFLPQLKIERCRQCDDDGWGMCRREEKCVIKDDFAPLMEKLKDADAAVFSTPVYFGDLSESLRAFLDRLRRTIRHAEGIKDKPAIGICVAGGGGGGAPSCCLSLDTHLIVDGFDVIDMVPVRRQNLEMKLELLRSTGERVVS